MIKFIKNLLQKPDKTLSCGQVVMPEPPDSDLDDLKNNFQKRTSGFEFYRKKLSPENIRLLYWIGSIDYSGYIRETSLKYLTEHYLPGDENRILLRLEDWVVPVRNMAQEWTQKYFPTLTLMQLNENYQLLLYLSRKEKLRQNGTLEFTEACLIEKLRDIDQRQFADLHPRFRRYLYQLSLCKLPKLRQWICFDKEPFNRLELFNFYRFDELTSEERSYLQRDRSVFVRRTLLNLQLRNNIVPSEDELKSACFDKNAGIRELARFCLSKYYHLDAYQLYKQQCNEAACYLADYAEKEDMGYFLEGIGSENSDIKYLCLKAICKIDYRYLSQLPIKELLADKKKIRQTVCLYLPKIFTIEQIMALKDDFIHIHPNGIQIFLNVIFHKSFWYFLDSSLSLLVNNASTQHIQSVCQKFYQKSYIYERLSDILRHSITEKLHALDQHKNYYISELVRQIRFMLACSQTDNGKRR